MRLYITKFTWSHSCGPGVNRTIFQSKTRFWNAKYDFHCEKLKNHIFWFRTNKKRWRGSGTSCSVSNVFFHVIESEKKDFWQIRRPPPYPPLKCNFLAELPTNFSSFFLFAFWVFFFLSWKLKISYNFWPIL